MSEPKTMLDGQGNLTQQEETSIDIDNLDLENIDLDTATKALTQLYGTHKEYKSNSNKGVEKMSQQIKDLKAKIEEKGGAAEEEEEGGDDEPPKTEPKKQAKKAPKTQEDQEPTAKEVYKDALDQIPDSLRGRVADEFDVLSGGQELDLDRTQVLLDKAIDLVNAQEKASIPVFGKSFGSVATNSKEKNDKKAYNETAEFLADYQE